MICRVFKLVTFKITKINTSTFDSFMSYFYLNGHMDIFSIHHSTINLNIYFQSVRHDVTFQSFFVGLLFQTYYTALTLSKHMLINLDLFLNY